MHKSNRKTKPKTAQKQQASHFDFTKGSDNVFADLGFESEVATSLLVRSQLVIRIEQALKEKGWTQKQAAKHLGIAQPRISELMTGQIQKFTIDTLMGYLEKLGITLSISTSGSSSTSVEESHWEMLISAGVRHLEVREFARAVEFLNDALSSARKLQNEELIADSNYLIAGIHVTQMQLAKAVPYLLEAVNHYQYTDETRKLYLTHYALGMVFANQKQLDKARESFQESILLAEALPFGAVNVESNFIWLAAIAEKKNDLTAAEKYLRRLLSIQKQRLGLKSPELTPTYELLERLCTKQGHIENARMFSLALQKLKERPEIKSFSMNVFPKGFPLWSKDALEQKA